MPLSTRIAGHLPYLRRYARALTGTQKSGDSYVKAALQALASGTQDLDELPPRVALYKLFQAIWGATGAKLETPPETGDTVSQRVMRIPPRHRQAFLLTALEGFTIDEYREATRGFFGTISTSLASVLEHSFKTIGRPTAYVLGTEGGGAFFAGLRFGGGTLFMRSLLYTSPSPRDRTRSRLPSSA
mgnify:CR=1 FL=1